MYIHKRVHNTLSVVSSWVQCVFEFVGRVCPWVGVRTCVFTWNMPIKDIDFSGVVELSAVSMLVCSWVRGSSVISSSCVCLRDLCIWTINCQRSVRGSSPPDRQAQKKGKIGAALYCRYILSTQYNSGKIWNIFTTCISDVLMFGALRILNFRRTSAQNYLWNKSMSLVHHMCGTPHVLTPHFFGIHISTMQNIVSFIGLSCKRDLKFKGAY